MPCPDGRWRTATALAAILVATLASAGSASGQAGGPGASAPGPSAGAPPPATTVASQDVVRRVAAGETVDLTDATLQGDVDLRAVVAVARPLRCQRCRVMGSLRAADVVFERIVELRDSRVDGVVEMDGAVFKDRTSFDGTVFGGRAGFVAARFLGDASFARGRFADAGFHGAKFEARADFAQRRFDGVGDFEGAVFADGTSFLLAEFVETARFAGAELRDGASFRLLRLHAGASFDRLSSRGLLDFKGAVLDGDVSLTNLASSGPVSLVGILFGRTRLFMDQLTVGDLSMDVAAVTAVRGRTTQKEVLELLDRSAQQRGDLAVANDARYRLLALQGEDKDDALGRLLDTVFYRGVAGYLVRPTHPLVAFLALLVVATLVRSGPRLWRLVAGGEERTDGAGGDAPARRRMERWRGVLLWAEKAVTVVLGALADAVAVSFRPRPRISVQYPERAGAYLVAALQWVEFLSYKVLLAVFVLALGNSNATIRQVLDTVRN